MKGCGGLFLSSVKDYLARDTVEGILFFYSCISSAWHILCMLFIVSHHQVQARERPHLRYQMRLGILTEN
jgi:hypothetical protein